MPNKHSHWPFINTCFERPLSTSSLYQRSMQQNYMTVLQVFRQKLKVMSSTWHTLDRRHRHVTWQIYQHPVCALHRKIETTNTLAGMTLKAPVKPLLKTRSPPEIYGFCPYHWCMSALLPWSCHPRARWRHAALLVQHLACALHFLDKNNTVQYYYLEHASATHTDAFTVNFNTMYVQAEWLRRKIKVRLTFYLW